MTLDSSWTVWEDWRMVLKLSLHMCVPYTPTTSLPETSVPRSASPHLGPEFKLSVTAVQGTVIPSALCLSPPHARPILMLPISDSTSNL